MTVCCFFVVIYTMSNSEHLNKVLQKILEDTAAYKVCSHYLLRTHKGFGSLILSFISVQTSMKYDTLFT